MAYDVPKLEVQSSSTFTDELIHNLHDMKEHGTLTDFTIKCHSITIPCHSVVMAAASPYFKELFNSSLKEAAQKQVELDFMNEQCLQDIVDYCYHGSIIIDFDDAFLYLEVVDYFQIVSLKIRIHLYLCEHLMAKNCIGLYYQADKYQLGKLRKQAKAMMISSFSEVIKHEEFQQLTLPQLIDYIKEDVAVNNHDTVLVASIDWVSFDVKTRRTSFLEILQCVRLDQCSLKYIKHALKSVNQSWGNFLEIQQIVLDAILNLIPDLESEPQKMPRITVLGGYTLKKMLNRTCWTLDFNNGTSDVLSYLPHTDVKYDSAHCLTPKGIFLGGGSTSSHYYSATVDCSLFCIKDHQWKNLPKLSTPSDGARAVHIDNHVFVLGGQEDRANVVECLNLSTGKWKSCPPLLQKNIWPIVASIHHKAYIIFNNADGNAPFQTGDEVTMQCYDTELKTWRFLATLPDSLKKNLGASAVTMDSQLFLVGGLGCLCACYSPSDDAWTLLQQPVKVHCYGSAIYYDGKIFLCGGKDDNNQCCDIIEVYDVKQNTWTVCDVKLPVPLAYHICTVCD